MNQFAPGVSTLPLLIPNSCDTAVCSEDTHIVNTSGPVKHDF